MKTSYIKSFEANINNLAAYSAIHYNTEVDYYCVQLEGFELQGDFFTSNGCSLYGVHTLSPLSIYTVRRDDCVVAGPAGELCLVPRPFLCTMFVRQDGTPVDMSRLRSEYDWFAVRINPKYAGTLRALAVPKGYVLNTAGLRTNGGYGKRGHGTCDYILCHNNDLRDRYIVNGVVLGLESKEGQLMQPKVKKVLSSLEDVKQKIEIV